MAIANLIAFILVAIGALNWGLYGIFKFNLVSAIFGKERNFFNTLIYILVFLGGVWLIISASVSNGALPLI